MDVIAFPFAGGNKYSFRQFLNGQEHNVIEFPRKTLIAKSLEGNLLSLLIDDLFPIVREKIKDSPYCIYGHSMGGLIAYLITQRIEKEGLRKPVRLIISGSNAPKYCQIEKISHLNKLSFWKEIMKLGGIPKSVEKDKQIINYFVPILKYDFKVIESYTYQRKNKITIPIDVFFGKKESVKTIGKEDWKNESSKQVSIVELTGDHFFIYNNIDYFKTYFKTLKQLNHV